MGYGSDSTADSLAQVLPVTGQGEGFNGMGFNG